MKENLKVFPLLLIALIITSSIFLFGFNSNKSIEPKSIYRVYLDGKSIGSIENKAELENYINREQTTLKEKYHVDKVHLPVGLEIKKEITYDNNISTSAEIYEKIKDLKPFTISGYIVTINGKEKKRVNVLDKEIFTNAVDRIIRTFISSDDYNKFLQNNQNEIKTVGKIIEDVSVAEEIYIRKTNISANEQIFTNEDDLTKYLLFGPKEFKAKYTVLTGDTIEKVAFDNGLSNEEFLVANPQFTDVNNLLYVGQQVSVDLIVPQISVVEKRYIVEDQVKDYKTEVRYDSKMLVGNSYELQSGIQGLDRVTKEVEIVNGQISGMARIIGVNELKPSVNRVLVKGGKILPNIGDKGLWAWPTITPYIITSSYGPRWGSFHDGLDISGCGYGSPIYAANNGTVFKTGYDSIGGNSIIINHNNGYYTYYGHLAKINVRVGQVIQRGQFIGTMGHSGYTLGTTGTHLHFAVFTGGIPFRDGYPISPYTLYRR